MSEARVLGSEPEPFGTKALDFLPNLISSQLAIQCPKPAFLTLRERLRFSWTHDLLKACVMFELSVCLSVSVPPSQLGVSDPVLLLLAIN